MRHTVPAVRILPMSTQQEWFRGRSVEEVQSAFFLQMFPFPPSNGRYQYPTSGLNADPGTVVLFQYGHKIIASAVFEHHERFAEPENGYRGELWFDVDSIRTFDPVSPEQLREIWPDFSKLGQAKQTLDPAYYSAFEKQLVNVRRPKRRT